MTEQPDDKKKEKKAEVPARWLDELNLDPALKVQIAGLSTLANQVNSIIRLSISPTMLAASQVAAMNIPKTSLLALSTVGESMLKYQPVLQTLRADSILKPLAAISDTVREYKLRPVETNMLANRSNEEQIKIDAAMVAKIAQLEEENEDLRRTIELLRSKKKGDYIK